MARLAAALHGRATSSKLQIMYGAGGERRLDEWEVGWLPGYEGSAPVRVGNAASGQFQLDVYGEVMSALYEACQVDGVHSRAVWDLQSKLIEFLEDGWKQPDDGIWEVRGPRRHFTHSKVMAWVAVDRAVRTMEVCPELAGPLEKWRALRDEIHAEVCEKGFDAEQGAFTQYYGSDELDASVLMIPLVGFLPASDPRVVSTVEAIERELLQDGFVLRYRTTDDGAVDGLSGREGAFLACSFWLADCLHMIGRVDDARALFERLLAAAQRPGAALRGVRPGGRPAGRQLPPGVLARLAGQHGLPAERPRPGPSDQAPEGGPPRVRRRLLADGHPGARGGGWTRQGRPPRRRSYR